MPTFPAVIALERFLQQEESNGGCNHHDYESGPPPPPMSSKPKSPHIYISPALYTTPNPTPVPNSSPSSTSPSPYVVNRKRRTDIPLPPDLPLRGFSVMKEQDYYSQGDGDGDGDGTSFAAMEKVDEALLDAPFFKFNDEEQGDEIVEQVNAEDEFADPYDSMSVDSSCASNCPSSRHRLLSTQSEFYDAPDDFLSDGSTSLPSNCSSSNIEYELHAARLSLCEEIDRRKKAEEAVDLMRSQWQRIVNCLSQADLAFPMILETGEMQLEIESAEQCCQEIITARFVSEAVGRGLARAESEADAEVIIDSKNQEIARLQDKLQYYEAVNHEMSQRNQEIKEMSRMQRQSCLRRKKWIWSCIGLSVALGASVLAFSYLPDLGKPPVTSDDGTDTS